MGIILRVAHLFSFLLVSQCLQINLYSNSAIARETLETLDAREKEVYVVGKVVALFKSVEESGHHWIGLEVENFFTGQIVRMYHEGPHLFPGNLMQQVFHGLDVYYKTTGNLWALGKFGSFQQRHTYWGRDEIWFNLSVMSGSADEVALKSMDDLRYYR